jgi:hypothetical protein
MLEWPILPEMIANPISSVHLGQGFRIAFMCWWLPPHPLVLSSVEGCALVKILVKGIMVYAQRWFDRLTMSGFRACFVRIWK